ncbi:MAG TPA: cupin domain-containing protein [Gemmatimonadales bacterium]|nr:cupin domain-containing protein [Gemmatimonadales bacterium]
MRHALVVLSLTLVAGSATAQGAPSAGKPHAIVVLPDQVPFGPAPASLPAGAKLAVLEGNPAAAGPFTMRLWVPDGYRIPPHYHPAVEHVTVVKGTFKVGMGEKFDPSLLNALPVGTFAALAPGMRHFAQAEGETVIQLHGTGPWSLTYVNPADDPRQRQSTP